MDSTDETRQLDGKCAEDCLNWAGFRFGARAVFACSFGAEDMVLLDMIANSPPDAGRRIRVVTLDTGRLFPETYDLMQEAHERYGVPIETIFPDRVEVEALVRCGGPNLFYHSIENRKACCRVRKVLPLNRALKGAEAWIVGLRRDQSAERSEVEPLSRDPTHEGIWKLSPLANWSWEDVMRYVREHAVPINRLQSKGFSSIGCAPCTRAVAPGADPRSGRWWWETGAKECGLHPSVPLTSTAGTARVAPAH